MIDVGMPLLRCCWGCIEPERTYTYEGDMGFACRFRQHGVDAAVSSTS